MISVAYLAQGRAKIFLVIILAWVAGVNVLDGYFYVAVAEDILVDSSTADPNGDILHDILSGGRP